MSPYWTRMLVGPTQNGEGLGFSSMDPRILDSAWRCPWWWRSPIKMVAAYLQSPQPMEQARWSIVQRYCDWIMLIIPRATMTWLWFYWAVRWHRWPQAWERLTCPPGKHGNWYRCHEKWDWRRHKVNWNEISTQSPVCLISGYIFRRTEVRISKRIALLDSSFQNYFIVQSMNWQAMDKGSVV